MSEDKSAVPPGFGSEHAIAILNEELTKRDIVVGVIPKRAIEDAVNLAVDQIETDRANSAIQAGEMHDRALVAEKRVTTLEAALRSAPMPIKESKLSEEDEWDEKYNEWWHENASERAIRR